jgi:hypothetical protein
MLLAFRTELENYLALNRKRITFKSSEINHFNVKQQALT